MKFLVTLAAFFLFSFCAAQSISVCSWNIQNFGRSKSDSEIDFIATTIKNFDVIAIQEVVAGDGGAQAVSRLVNVLNQKGNKWEYSVSHPTFSSSYKTERYAFIWKSSRVKRIGKAWMEQQFKIEIDREPYYATFTNANKEFTLVNFHAITKSKQPETEIKFFKFLPSQYPEKNLIFAGDFNCPQNHTVFNPLKTMGYLPALISQKTSLKKSCEQDNCLASEFDNIFYNKQKVNFISAGVVEFHRDFQNFSDARTISDHLPVFFEFSLN